MAATPGDFTFLADYSHEVQMLDSAYKAVSSVDGAWDFLKTYSPPEGEGFMFVRNPPLKLKQIEDAILAADGGHSGSSFGFVMRAMEYIAKNGWDGYIDLRTNNLKKILQKKVNQLEDENARLRQQITELTNPKKDSMTREEKIRAALAKGCTGGYPCAGCLARKNMLVEDWHAEQERMKMVKEDKPSPSPLASLVTSATAVDNFIASAPPTNSLTAFADAFQNNAALRARIPDIDQQADGLRRFAEGKLSYFEMRSICG